MDLEDERGTYAFELLLYYSAQQRCTLLFENILSLISSSHALIFERDCTPLRPWRGPLQEILIGFVLLHNKHDSNAFNIHPEYILKTNSSISVVNIVTKIYFLVIYNIFINKNYFT